MARLPDSLARASRPGTARMLLACGLLAATTASAQRTELVAPAGSERFGAGVRILRNGNIVVIGCASADTGLGSVSLFRPDGSHVSTLTGSSPGDCVGNGGLHEVGDHHFVVLSPNWQHGAVDDAGAVTWIDGELGLGGVVSAANSLVGSSAQDLVGDPANQPVLVLRNGHYLVQTVRWDNGVAMDAGAVAWGDGNAGVSGAISAANALVGTRTGDVIGSVHIGHALHETASGDYLVRSPWLDGDGQVDIGALTWGSGSIGVRGEVGAHNSLLGARDHDRVGDGIPVLLAGGTLAFPHRFVDGDGVADIGALTWTAGDAPQLGVVDGSNSLLGLHAGDQLGERVAALANGNVALGVPKFGADDLGVVVVLDGDALPIGPLDVSAGLTGSHPGDQVGNRLEALPNGHFIVASSHWRHGGQLRAGAVTWVDGEAGLTGPVTATNSLVGTRAGDLIGERTRVLPGSQYVVLAPFWSSGTHSRIGAVTVGDGAGGLSGPVSVDNSLVGGRNNDLVGDGGVTVLANGNIVVVSRDWARGDTMWAGAATWMDANAPLVGVVTEHNSLVGTAFNDGRNLRAHALVNGHAVASAPGWDHDKVTDVGAVTWIDGHTGLSGAIGPRNSLIGGSSGDFPDQGLSGSHSVWPLANGHYVVNPRYWDGWDGQVGDLGAVAWVDGRRPTAETISEHNALVGTVMADQVGTVNVHGVDYVVTAPGYDGAGILNGGVIALVRGSGPRTGLIDPGMAVFGLVTSSGIQDEMRYAYDVQRDLLVVGRPAEGRVTLLRIDALFGNGFD